MRYVALLLVAVAAIAGCAQRPAAAIPTPRPPATIAPFFGDRTRPLPTLDIPSPAPRPTTNTDVLSSDASILQATAQRDSLDSVIDEVVFFDEGLDPSWTAEHSFDQRINLRSAAFASSGFTSLEAVPEVPFGGLMLTLTSRSRNLFPRADVLGVRFAVTGGSRALTPNNLIVKVLGSNRYPYFVENDSSVPRPPDLGPDRLLFPEVALDALGLRRDLEPGEWAEVELWLDGYDQVDYNYVTGLVIFNDELFLDPFYIDNVRLLVRWP